MTDTPSVPLNPPAPPRMVANPPAPPLSAPEPPLAITSQNEELPPSWPFVPPAPTTISTTSGTVREYTMKRSTAAPPPPPAA
ncbi:MAG: hypothetical protein WBB10_02020 [Rhodococcus qingshengii]